MKLLICTQKVDKDDPILGFFHNWIIEFSKNFESVIVVCLFKGNSDLPFNVKVLSLGKEERQSRLQYLIHFYWYIWYERKNYDAVFVHMNQIYVVLAGFLWKIWKKKITLWYTHRAVSMGLRIATIFSNKIFTASKDSFNIKSNKVAIMGHGIDISKFEKKDDFPHKRFTILSVGRITRIKNLETLIKTCLILKRQNHDFICNIIGPRVTPDDNIYYDELTKLIKENRLMENIFFKDAVSNENIREYYWNSDININLSPTGGVDKVILEGIASSCLPLVSNTTFREIFGNYNDKLIFEYRNSEDLAEKILELKSNYIDIKDNTINKYLFDKVNKDFNSKSLIKNISDKIRE